MYVESADMHPYLSVFPKHTTSLNLHRHYFVTVLEHLSVDGCIAIASNSDKHTNTPPNMTPLCCKYRELQTLNLTQTIPTDMYVRVHIYTN